jgi:hypothetical protein
MAPRQGDWSLRPGSPGELPRNQGSDGQIQVATRLVKLKELGVATALTAPFPSAWANSRAIATCTHRHPPPPSRPGHPQPLHRSPLTVETTGYTLLRPAVVLWVDPEYRDGHLYAMAGSTDVHGTWPSYKHRWCLPTRCDQIEEW